MRLTLLKPRPGREPEALRVLEELDQSIAPAPGLLFSFVLGRSAPRLGRVSLWRSKDDANRQSVTTHTLALRSRLHSLSVDTDEKMVEVEPGQLQEALRSTLAVAKRAERGLPVL